MARLVQMLCLAVVKCISLHHLYSLPLISFFLFQTLSFTRAVFGSHSPMPGSNNSWLPSHHCLLISIFSLPCPLYRIFTQEGNKTCVAPSVLQTVMRCLWLIDILFFSFLVLHAEWLCLKITTVVITWHTLVLLITLMTHSQQHGCFGTAQHFQ